MTFSASGGPPRRTRACPTQPSRQDHPCIRVIRGILSQYVGQLHWCSRVSSSWDRWPEHSAVQPRAAAAAAMGLAVRRASCPLRRTVLSGVITCRETARSVDFSPAGWKGPHVGPAFLNVQVALGFADRGKACRLLCRPDLGARTAFTIDPPPLSRNGATIWVSYADWPAVRLHQNRR